MNSQKLWFQRLPWILEFCTICCDFSRQQFVSYSIISDTKELITHWTWNKWSLFGEVIQVANWHFVMPNLAMVEAVWQWKFGSQFRTIYLAWQLIFWASDERLSTEWKVVVSTTACPWTGAVNWPWILQFKKKCAIIFALFHGNFRPDLLTER